MKSICFFLVFLNLYLANGEQPCTQENGVLGKCVPLEKCVLDEGVFQRSNKLFMCGGDQSDLVCCRKPKIIAKNLCDAWRTYYNQIKGNNTCQDNKPLIVGGTEANVGEFPHIASLGIDKKGDGVITWNCGGTLISPHFVLTAAHCVNSIEENSVYHVVLGEHDLTTTTTTTLTPLEGDMPQGLYNHEELLPTNRRVPLEQSRRVVEVIQHPEYVYRYHDIALVRLESPVVFTERAIPACLDLNQNHQSNKKLITMGWGRVNAMSIEASKNKLLKVVVPVVDSLICYLKLGDPGMATRGITSDQICAGSEGRDSCAGDSGGPLILTPNETKTCEQVLVGLTSFGDGCGIVGVYTRVSSYIDWITSYIAPGYVA